MCLIIRIILGLASLLVAPSIQAQNKQNHFDAHWFEVGAVLAEAEASYYGFYSRYSFPLTRQRSHFALGIGLTSYFDFVGEIDDQITLENDVDLRIIPNIFLAYNLNVDRFEFSLEIPLGMSLAITRGKLINERIGFERTYSNTEVFLHYGIGLSTRFQINEKNQVCLYGFLPLVKDLAWSSPTLGVGWRTNLAR